MIGLSPFGASTVAGLSTRAIGAQSATLALDSSGYGRHGTYIGSPQLGVDGLLDGDPDKAAGFPTEASYVSVGDYSAFSFTANAFAIELWYQDRWANSASGLLSKRTDVLFEYAVYRVGTALEFRAWAADGTVIYEDTYSAVGTDKHHYVWTADGSFARLYVDRVLASTVAKQSGNMAGTAAPLLLASGSSNAAETVTDTPTDTLRAVLAESAALFVRISTGETLGTLLSDARVSFGVPPDILFLIRGDTLAIGCVEPEDVQTDMVSAESLRVTVSDSASTPVDVTGGVRTDIGILTRLSPAGCPGKAYTQPATRTVGILTRLSPAGFPGKAI